MSKDLTLEQAIKKIAVLQEENKTLKSQISEKENEISKLNEEKETLTTQFSEKENEISKLNEEKETLTTQLSEKEKEVLKMNKEVPGVYKHKESGNFYKFKKGCLSFLLKGKRVNSEDVLKDSKIMDELIEDGFGLIEIVQP